MINSSKFTLFSLIILLCSCSNSATEDYIPISPVNVDLTEVPYTKLSEYRFFEDNADQNHLFTGSMKELKASIGVLPYEPASSLFTDYAHKKRFVWIPKNAKATYNGDGNVLELPIGSALIKSFYYDDVQNVTPIGSRRIIETRVMIRKAEGWIFANYIWNSDQTEAYLDNNGSFTEISWIENGIQKSTNYRIPSESQCIVCHKKEVNSNGILNTVHTPIGIKPQNLNFVYNYKSENKNQLLKWIEDGYLEDGFELPNQTNSTINYNDTSKPLTERVRSYFDINCAHCHQQGGQCDYTSMRFAFSETANNLQNLGVCVATQDMQGFSPSLSKIVTPNNINRSMLHFRMNTTNESYRMPLHGRTLIHEEGVELVKQWINSLQPCQ